MKAKILIIEDEMKYAYILERFFTSDDYEVTIAFDGMSGLQKFKETDPDIICLDIMLPKMDGWEVAKRIREVSNVPIIMMSALSEDGDILKGYGLHVDDYVTKPFRTPILLAKVNNILERRRQLQEQSRASLLQGVDENKDLTAGKIRLVRKNMQCYINDEIVKITKTEYKLLEYLMENRGKNCTRESLFHTFWEGRDIDDRIIDTYIKKLRKLVANGECEIITAFGIGYRFEERK
ncbi:response regulator transcription factor [bacterium]|nr:response regulator transcription factor [bacterium]